MQIQEIKTGFDIIPIQVSSTASDSKETDTYRTDKDHKRVIGLALSIANSSALPGCKIGVKINGEEVLPKNFEAKFLYVEDGKVPPNDRFYYFGPVNVNESEVDIKWTDGGSVVPSGYASGLYLYLLCEKSEE